MAKAPVAMEANKTHINAINRDLLFLVAAPSRRKTVKNAILNADVQIRIEA
jgi:hypothetical protein